MSKLIFIFVLKLIICFKTEAKNGGIINFQILSKNKLIVECVNGHFYNNVSSMFFDDKTNFVCEKNKKSKNYEKQFSKFIQKTNNNCFKKCSNFKKKLPKNAKIFCSPKSKIVYKIPKIPNFCVVTCPFGHFQNFTKINKEHTILIFCDSNYKKFKFAVYGDNRIFDFPDNLFCSSTSDNKEKISVYGNSNNEDKDNNNLQSTLKNKNECSFLSKNAILSKFGVFVKILECFESNENKKLCAFECFGKDFGKRPFPYLVSGDGEKRGMMQCDDPFVEQIFCY
ncbi:hypothetical protein MHBO_005289 [Bonamia ostreae]|uniref:Uncharacterized protein n=1 Tax=Bonamia ostreae TaxID=126728 RepID=A0ABV2AS71_9EUKA